MSTKKKLKASGGRPSPPGVDPLSSSHNFPFLRLEKSLGAGGSLQAASPDVRPRTSSLGNSMEPSAVLKVTAWVPLKEQKHLHAAGTGLQEEGCRFFLKALQHFRHKNHC